MPTTAPRDSQSNVPPSTERHGTPAVCQARGLQAETDPPMAAFFHQFITSAFRSRHRGRGSESEAALSSRRSVRWGTEGVCPSWTCFPVCMMAVGPGWLTSEVPCEGSGSRKAGLSAWRWVCGAPGLWPLTSVTG